MNFCQNRAHFETSNETNEKCIRHIVSVAGIMVIYHAAITNRFVHNQLMNRIETAENMRIISETAIIHIHKSCIMRTPRGMSWYWAPICVRTADTLDNW